MLTGAVPGAAPALERAVAWLIERQSPPGWWKGELETNVTMDAEDLLLRHVLGILTPSVVEQSARWIRSQQRADGTWANFFGGPGDLSTTVEAYAALRMAGDAPGDVHMAKAREFVLREGGMEAARTFTRIWMALVGQWSWDDLPALPPEVVLLPSWAPFNIYAFGCWARQTIVALTVVAAHRLTVPIPFSLEELRTGRSNVVARAGTTERTLAALDRVLRVYERSRMARLPRAVLRRRALAKAERWIVRRQESDGSWGGIQPPWVYSLLALHVLGYPLDHPTMRAGLEGIDRFTVVEAGSRRLEACQSPVWDTALAVLALSDAGLRSDNAAMVSAADWLVAQEIRHRGDWAVRRPDLTPGGWAFEFANANYPDIDDAAEVIMALRRVESTRPPELEVAVARGVNWVLGMQSRDGGWGAFDVDNDSRLCTALPFCDFGAVTDPPSADVTAHVLEMLSAEPSADSVAVAQGLRWLLSEQENDGSWFGRWGANYVYGTAAAVPALVAAGVPRTDPAIARAVAWLERHQNGDGGWGEDMRSYDDPSWRGRGESTASQTAWALLALLAAGRHDTTAVRRGVEWLVSGQTPEGTWDEPWFTGTGFPGDFFINYHLYRHTFPVMALGRYLNGDAS